MGHIGSQAYNIFADIGIWSGSVESGICHLCTPTSDTLTFSNLFSFSVIGKIHTFNSTLFVKLAILQLQLFVNFVFLDFFVLFYSALQPVKGPANAHLVQYG